MPEALLACAARPGPAAPRLRCRITAADRPLLRRLGRHGPLGRVHSVFRRVVNVEAADGQLFTMACRTLDQAPATAVVDLEDFAGSCVRAGEAVTGTERGITLGTELFVAIDGAQAWDAALPAWPASTAGLRRSLALVDEATRRHRASLMAPEATDSPFLRECRTQVDARADRLVRALAAGDLAAARQHGASLLGLGTGLTPSGDDFLLGLFAVLNVRGSPCHPLNRAGREIAALADGATNAISLAAVRHAAAGRVRSSIAALIECMFNGEVTSLSVALRQVLAIGSSSGADIVAGIVAGCSLNLQVGDPSCR